MYQTDLTKTEWKYITKVLKLQERKRKYCSVLSKIIILPYAKQYVSLSAYYKEDI